MIMQKVRMNIKLSGPLSPASHPPPAPNRCYSCQFIKAQGRGMLSWFSTSTNRVDLYRKWLKRSEWKNSIERNIFWRGERAVIYCHEMGQRRNTVQDPLFRVLRGNDLVLIEVARTRKWLLLAYSVIKIRLTSRGCIGKSLAWKLYQPIPALHRQ